MHQRSKVMRAISKNLLGGVVLAASIAGVRAGMGEERSAAETQAVVAFQARVADYVALHRKLEAGLPKLPKKASPEQVDTNQRNLGLLIKNARSDAKRGQLFAPDMEALIKRTLAAIVTGPDGKIMKASIMDENPGVPDLGVNDRYPDSVPLSTMPPEVLEALPRLDEDIEYRFIGERLVLMDAHAHIVIDFTDDVLP
jgi:hypothetical protein